MPLPQVNDVPAPAFGLYERVRLKDDASFQPGEAAGTVIALDSDLVRRPNGGAEAWAYIVHFPTTYMWRTCLQRQLVSTGGFDDPAAHASRQPEISFDLVIEERNSFMEGTYRLPGQPWQVVIFQRAHLGRVKFAPTAWPKPTPWETPATGLVVRVPRLMKLGRVEMCGILSRRFGVNEWADVRGPDSIVLR